MAKDVITNSRIQTATCLRREYLAYQLRLRPVRESNYFRIGRAVHYGIDLYNKGEKNIVNAVMLKYEQTKPLNYIYDWEIEKEVVRTLLVCYMWRWEEMDREIEIVASEQKFEIPIINPDTGRQSKTAVLAGVIDGIIKLPDGRLAIKETKTRAGGIEPENDFWKRLRIDNQVSEYFWAAQYLGYNVDTIIYDVMQKPTIRALKATPHENRKYKADGSLYANQRDVGETPAEYGERYLKGIGENPDLFFARREIPRLDEDIKDFQRELWQTIAIFRDCNKYRRWPKKTNLCIGFGKCPYFDLCTSSYDINSGIVPDGFEIVEDINPELTGD
jgi:hypothetical protein